MDTLALIILLILSAWSIIVYNLLVRDRNRMRAAWSDINVQLKRRHDLIPKLVDAVKQYADYEQATLSSLVELRNQSERARTIGEKGALETVIGHDLHRLIALAEQYPNLKANTGFLDLQHNLTEVENQIQYARRYYNGAVRNLNIRIDSFPDLLVARLFRYDKADYFALANDPDTVNPEGSP